MKYSPFRSILRRLTVFIAHRHLFIRNVKGQCNRSIKTLFTKMPFCRKKNVILSLAVCPGCCDIHCLCVGKPFIAFGPGIKRANESRFISIRLQQTLGTFFILTIFPTYFKRALWLAGGRVSRDHAFLLYCR